MQKTIVFEPLNNKRFDVAVQNVFKEAKGRYFPNASDCCGAPLREQKSCASCGKGEGEAHTKGKTKRKVFEIGGEAQLIPTDALGQIQDIVNQKADDIVITSVLKKFPFEARERIDGVARALPLGAKKSADQLEANKQYAQVVKILQAAGGFAVGTTVFGNYEFQVVLEATDDGLNIYKLASESRMYDFDREATKDVIKSAPVNPQLVELSAKVLEKSAADKLPDFKPVKEEMTEKLIEDFVLHGKLPEVSIAEVKESKEKDELEQLRALLG